MKLTAVLELITKSNVRNAMRDYTQLRGEIDKTAAAAENVGTQNKSLRGVAGARGAAGRDFAGMARGIGGTGVVAAYAEAAANIFALTAAFQALSSAARTEQLTEGLRIVGAQAGNTLGLVSTKLQEVTGYTLTTAEAMKSVASATAAGFSSKEIERLGVVARGASSALGRDLSDSMDRLTRGTIKLEPELLDELGIMTRLDEAVKQYALQNNKSVDSLTQVERRQAFLNAVLAEGESKFGSIAEQISTNPYDKLGASVKQLGTDFLNFTNGILKPLVSLLSEAPTLALIPFAGVIKDIASKIMPTAGSAIEKMNGTVQILTNNVKYSGEAINQMTSDYSEATAGMRRSAGGMKSRGIAGLGGKEGLKELLKSDTGEVISKETAAKALPLVDKALASINQKLANGNTLTDKQTKEYEDQAKKLLLIKRNLTEIDGYHDTILLTNQKLTRQKLQQARIETEINRISQVEGTFTLGLLPGLGESLEQIGEAWGDSQKRIKADTEKLSASNNTLWGNASKNVRRFGIVAGNTFTALTTSARIFAVALNNIFIPLTIAIGAVTAGFALYEKFFTSEAEKRAKKLREELKLIIENTKEVKTQIDLAFQRQNYAQGFEGALGALTEIRNKIIEIQTISSSKKISDSLFGKNSPFDTKFRYGMIENMLSGGKLGQGEKVARETADLLNLIDPKRAKQYADEILRSNQSYEEVLTITDKYTKGLDAASKSFTSIEESAKNLNKSLSKFYGKSIFETDYTQILNDFKAINVEIKALENTKFADKFKEGAAIFDKLKAAGPDVVFEIERLSGETGKFKLAWDAVGAAEQAYQDSLKTGTKKEQAASLDQLNKFKLAAIELYKTLGIVQLTTAENLKFSLLSTESQISKLKETLTGLQVQTQKINSQINREIIANRYIRLGGLGEFGTAKTAATNEAQAAKEAYEFSKRTASAKIAVINAEFELLKEQRKLELGKAQKELNTLKGIKNRTAEQESEFQAQDNYVKALQEVLGLQERVKTAQVNAANAEVRATAQGVDNTIAKLDAQETIYELAKRQFDLESLSVTLLEARQKLEAENFKRADAKLKIEQEIADLTLGRLTTERDTLLRELEQARKDRTRLEGRGDTIDIRRAQIAANLAANEVERLKEVLSTAGLDFASGAITADQYAAALSDLAVAMEKSEIAAAEQAEAQSRANTEIDAATQRIDLLNAKLSTLGQEAILRIQQANKDMSTLISSVPGIFAAMTGNVKGFETYVRAEIGGRDLSTANFQQLNSAFGKFAKDEAITMRLENMVSLSQEFGNSMTGAFASIIDGSKNSAQAFRDMGNAMLQVLARIIAEETVLMLIRAASSAMSGFGGMPSSTPSPTPRTAVHSRALPVAAGGIIPMGYGGVMPMASGGIMERYKGVEGIVRQPTYLVGEGRYDEAVVPLPNGRAIPVQMHGEGSSQHNNVSVNINMSSNGQTTNQTQQGIDMNNLGRAIAMAVQNELQAQKRPGGILSRYGAS